MLLGLSEITFRQFAWFPREPYFFCRRLFEGADFARGDGPHSVVEVEIDLGVDVILAEGAVDGVEDGTVLFGRVRPKVNLSPAAHEEGHDRGANHDLVALLAEVEDQHVAVSVLLLVHVHVGCVVASREEFLEDGSRSDVLGALPAEDRGAAVGEVAFAARAVGIAPDGNGLLGVFGVLLGGVVVDHLDPVGHEAVRPVLVNIGLHKHHIRLVHDLRAALMLCAEAVFLSSVPATTLVAQVRLACIHRRVRVHSESLSNNRLNLSRLTASAGGIPTLTSRYLTMFNTFL